MKSQVRGGRGETGAGELAFSSFGIWISGDAIAAEMGGGSLDTLPLPREIDALRHRGEIVQAMHHDGDPRRFESPAQEAQPDADAEDLAEEIPVILQMQRGPCRRRQQDSADRPEHRLRPAAIEKAAREQLLGN